MNYKQNRAFQSAIAHIQKKFPECVVEAWTPDDYQTLTGRKLTKEDNIAIATELAGNFDASNGINWDVISFTIEGLGLHQDIDHTDNADQE